MIKTFKETVAAALIKHIFFKKNKLHRSFKGAIDPSVMPRYETSQGL